MGAACAGGVRVCDMRPRKQPLQRNCSAWLDVGSTCYSKAIQWSTVRTCAWAQRFVLASPGQRPAVGFDCVRHLLSLKGSGQGSRAP
eukprot:7390781-Prymnesium_polylepis.1